MKMTSSVPSAASAGRHSGRMMFQYWRQIAGAVDQRGLGQVGGEGLHVVGEHERAEADLERGVDDDHRDVGVEQVAGVAERSTAV